MIAGEDISPLADAHIRADRHAAMIVDPDHLAEPDVIADLQEPRRLDRHPRLADETLADPCTETTENGGLQSRREQATDRRLKEDRIDQIPRTALGDARIALDNWLQKARKIQRRNWAIL